MRILHTLVVGVTAGAAIVSSQLTLDTAEPWNLDSGGAVPAASIRLETARDCGDLDSKVRAVAKRMKADADHAREFSIDSFGDGEVVTLAPGAARGGPVTAESTAFDAAAPASADAGPSATSGSIVGTNIQEIGVDESDIIKTDGQTIFVLRDGRLVAIDAATLEEMDRIRWAKRHPSDMLLADDRIVLFESAWRETEAEPNNSSESAMHDYYGGTPVLRIIVVDVSDPSNLTESSVVEVEGGLVAARLTGGYVRVVTSSSPGWGSPMPMPGIWREGDDVAFGIAAEGGPVALDDVTADDILPSITVEEPGSAPATFTVPCDAVHVSREAETLESTTVFSLDPKDPKPIGEATALAGSGTVYANPRSIYVTRTHWEQRGRRGSESTEIHRFDISDPDQTRYASAGTVPGNLLNQFSMSEHEGLFRVATTMQPWSSNREQSESQVAVMREQGDRLVTIGTVGGLGLDERIYSVRFIGDLAYVVTFREVDPLYVVDLSDPRNPVVAGELKIPGYSAYLHPVGEGFLIGVGQDADNRGRTRGVQVSLFDVRDPANPKRVGLLQDLGDHSPVEYDHKAFQYLPQRNLIIVPATSWESGFQGEVVEGEAGGSDPDTRDESGSGSGGGADGDQGGDDVVTILPFPGDKEPAPSDGDAPSQPDVDEPSSPSSTREYRPSLPRSFAYLIEVTDDGMSIVGRISHRVMARASNQHRQGEVNRTIAIDDTLYTLSDAGIAASGFDPLRQLRTLAW